MELKKEGKQKNLWCFGDSFTYGTGCTPNSKYYEEYPDERAEIWPVIVGKELNLKINNLGVEGEGPALILKNTLENLPLIRKGDIVVVSSSRVNRLPLPDINNTDIKKGIVTIGTGIFSHKYQSFVKLPGKKKFFNSQVEADKFLDHINTHILPFDKEWETYYNIQFTGLVKSLNKLGIETYYWDYRLWDKKDQFETIGELNKPGIYDQHWSWKGHSDFATYLLKRIENKEYI